MVWFVKKSSFWSKYHSLYHSLWQMALFIITNVLIWDEWVYNEWPRPFVLSLSRMEGSFLKEHASVPYDEWLDSLSEHDEWMDNEWLRSFVTSEGRMGDHSLSEHTNVSIRYDCLTNE